MKLNAKQLRDLEHDEIVAPTRRYPVYLILDNIYDTYNIGGLFRLSDALAISQLYICGHSEIPPNIKIKRASIGTYKVVPWEYKKTVVEAIEEIKQHLLEAHIPISSSFGKCPPMTIGGRDPLPEREIRYQATNKTNPYEKNDIERFPLQIISIEQAKNSVPYQTIPYSTPVAFIVGNETTGVSSEAMQASDYIAEIPMLGVNKSLNVIVSAGIVMTHAYNQLKFF